MRFTGFSGSQGGCGCCGGGPAPCSCSPCDIPATNLTVTFVNKGGSCSGAACQVVGGAYTLTYSGTCASGQWLGTFNTIFEFPAGVFTPNTYSILMTCLSGSIQVTLYAFPTPLGPTLFCTLGSGGAAPTSFTCSPFMLQWAVADPGFVCGCCIGSITITP